MFLEISQNSQENTSARVFFLIKLQAWGSQWMVIIAIIIIYKVLLTWGKNGNGEMQYGTCK